MDAYEYKKKNEGMIINNSCFFEKVHAWSGGVDIY